MKTSLIIFFELLKFMQWFSDGCLEICCKLENHDGEDEYFENVWQKFREFLKMVLPTEEEYEEFRENEKELCLKGNLQELRNKKYYSLKEKITEWIKLLNTGSEADRLLVLSQMNDIVELYPDKKECEEK